MCEVDTVKEPIDSRLLALAAENETTFKLVKLGISKPCSVPDITSNFDHLAYLAVFRHVARLEVLDAKVKESSGDFAGAYQNYFDTFKLGQAVATNGVLINGLVGIAIDTIALRAMWPTIDSLSETQLQVVMGELEVASNNAVSYAAVMKQENQVMSFMMEKFSQRGYAYDVMWAMADRSKFPLIEAPRAIAGNLVWLYFIVMQHSNMAAMQEYLVKDEQFATAPYESIQERETLAYLEGDSSPIKANVYLNITAPALLRAKDAFKRRDAYYRGTYLKVARAWYNKSHSKLTNLEQLVEAGIIKSVPIDPFSGQPFKLVDGKIYSIGHDRKDDLAELNVFEKSEGGKNNPANYGDMVF